MGYGSDYAQNVSNILIRKGDATANAKLRSGEAWAGALGQIGQTIANLPRQIQQAKAASDDATLRQAKLDELAKSQKQAKVLADAYNASLLPDGKVDRQKLTAILAQAGMGQALPDLLKGLDEADLANLNVQKAKDAAKQATEEAEIGYAKTIGSQMLAADFNPEIVNGLLTVAKSHGHDVSQFETLWTKQPEQFKSFVSKLVQPPKAAEPFTLNPGDVRFDANGQPIANNPKPDAPVTFGAPTPAMLGGKRVFVRTGSDGQTYDMKGQPVAVEPTPIVETPKESLGGYTWAKDPKTGKVRMMREAEVAALGAEQPETADMRNKQAGKAAAARAVDAVKTLGEKIITRVGPAQRADAIKRGAEAVFGNDPDFRTYQDSRMALAGTLAVEQQGARVSDADVKALWLPMVPDAYRDTSESAALKWEIINAMRGVKEAAAPGGLNAHGLVTTPPPDNSGNWKWDGKAWVRK